MVRNFEQRPKESDWGYKQLKVRGVWQCMNSSGLLKGTRWDGSGIRASDKNKEAPWEPTAGGVLNMTTQLITGLYFLFGLKTSKQQNLEGEVGTDMPQFLCSRCCHSDSQYDYVVDKNDNALVRMSSIRSAKWQCGWRVSFQPSVWPHQLFAENT